MKPYKLTAREKVQVNVPLPSEYHAQWLKIFSGEGKTVTSIYAGIIRDIMIHDIYIQRSYAFTSLAKAKRRLR